MKNSTSGARRVRKSKVKDENKVKTLRRKMLIVRNGQKQQSLSGSKNDIVGGTKKGGGRSLWECEGIRMQCKRNAGGMGVKGKEDRKEEWRAAGNQHSASFRFDTPTSYCCGSSNTHLYAEFPATLQLQPGGEV